MKNLTSAGNTLAARLSTVPSNAMAMGAVGALFGGIAATAENTYKVAKGEMDSADAALNVVHETVGTGISAAAGSIAITVLGIGGIAGLVGLVAVASLTKGAWDRTLKGRLARNAEVVE